MTHDVAKSRILEAAGSHFDPDMVSAFLQVEDEFIAVKNHFSDDEFAQQNALAQTRPAVI